MVGWIAYYTVSWRFKQHRLAVTAQVNARCKNIHTELALSFQQSGFVQTWRTGWRVLFRFLARCFNVVVCLWVFESGCQLGHSDSAGLQNIEAVVHWGRLEIHWFSLTASLPLSSLSKWKIESLRSARDHLEILARLQVIWQRFWRQMLRMVFNGMRVNSWLAGCASIKLLWGQPWHTSVQLWE